MPTLNQLTPVMIVDSVEAGLDFWVSRLGFVVENQVPGPDGKLVFASAKKDAVEVMYQTRASVVADMPAVANQLDGHSIVLFLTVENLDEIEKALVGAPVLKARHTTFYGSSEIYVREPGGNTVGFAQFGLKYARDGENPFAADVRGYCDYNFTAEYAQYAEDAD